MKKILLAGGDTRTRILCERLKKTGFTVDTLGLFDEDEGKTEWADIIILPIPVTRDGRSICCPLTNRFVPIETVTQKGKEKLILGGGEMEGIDNYINYGNLDEYALLNAVPTAEGAIAAAVQNTDFCLWKSRVLVIGFGRVGKVLAERLIGMKCDVTVSARKPSDLALIDIIGANYINTADIAESGSFDIIFNTVDHPVLTFDTTLQNTLIIDLSTAGCIDADDAAVRGARYLKLPGLPGKTAPKTAGEILYSTVIGALRRKGELL